jgi:hypothetical protein
MPCYHGAGHFNAPEHKMLEQLLWGSHSRPS